MEEKNTMQSMADLIARKFVILEKRITELEKQVATIEATLIKTE